MQDIKLTTEKNGPASRAISMAMQIKRYGAERIAQYGRSRATLYATGRHHRASIHHVLPRQMPWSSIVGVKNRVVALWKSLPEASVKKAQNRPSTQLIKATSCEERWNPMMKAEELC